jgi:1,2-diacylglycerol 3-beta-galactosyltransferase
VLELSIRSGFSRPPEEGSHMIGTKHILILTADAGYGHRSAANAIAAALQELHPIECTISIINPLEDRRVPVILRKSGTQYDRIVREMPRFYKFNYEVSDSGPTSVMVHDAVAAMLFEVMGDLIRHYQPDAIVSPYPLYQAPLAANFALDQRDIPLLTVVTDLGPVHRLWFHKAADLCLVSTALVRQQAIDSGISPDKVFITGIPVHPNLANEKRKPAIIRKELGWLPGPLTVLAVGSKRMKNLPGLLNVLNHSGLPIQLAVVAGGDDALYRQMRSIEWHIPTQLFNFVDNMPTLMHAADCVICKAGGLVVTESLACGLPILLTDYIEGQETSNVRYVVDGGAGELVRTPIEGLEALSHWLAEDGKLLTQHSLNSRGLGCPRAAYAVAGLAWEAAMRGPQIWAERNLPEIIERIVRELL